MKKILTVYTGGTICCEADRKMRSLNPELAKRALISNFSESNSKYAELSLNLFEDSDIDEDIQTLSENMTLDKLWAIIKHIKSFSPDEYCGIIVMHGTDTLALTASLFSFVFSVLDIPLMIVSGNRPPLDEKSNANENFKVAVELIMSKIAPNVYVPYRNSNGEMWLHLGSNILQCANFTENFYGASGEKSFLINRRTYKGVLEKCGELKKHGICSLKELNTSVLYLRPYTGFDYSKIVLSGVKAVIHGTYHSGTVCVEINAQNEPYSPYSILQLAKECEKKQIPLFIVPSKLSSDQYSSAFDLVNNSSAVFLNMTAEAAYTKAIVGVSCGFTGDKLISFMCSEINNEMLD